MDRGMDRGMDREKVLMTRLVILLDLLYDGTKDRTGIWSLISDVIEGLLANH